jgi:hypothetical protein
VNASMNAEEIQEELQSILEKLEEIQSRIDEVLGDYGRQSKEDNGIDEE